MSLNKFVTNEYKPWLKLHANEIICPQGIKNNANQTHTFTPPQEQNNTHDGLYLSYNHTIQKTEWKAVNTLNFISNWDADTNTPNLQSGIGTKNDYYVVLNSLTNPSTATTLDALNSFSNGDWIIFNGSTWNKIDNQNTVQSINSKVGTVILNHSDLPDIQLNKTHNEIDADLNALITEQGTQNTNITNLQAEQITQNTNINNLQSSQAIQDSNLSSLNASQASQDSKIAIIELEQVTQNTNITTLQNKTTSLNTSSQLVNNLLPSVNLTYNLGSSLNKYLQTYTRDIICNKIQGDTAGPNSDLELINQANKGIIIRDGANGYINFNTDQYAGNGPNSKAGKYLRILNDAGDIEAVTVITGSGDVVGPISSTLENVAIFADSTGKLLKNSSVNINGNMLTSTQLTCNDIYTENITSSLSVIDLKTDQGFGINIGSGLNSKISFTGNDYSNKVGQILSLGDTNGGIQAIPLQQSQVLLRQAKTNTAINSGNNDTYVHSFLTTYNNIIGATFNNQTVTLPSGLYSVSGIGTAFRTASRLQLWVDVLGGYYQNEESLVTYSNPGGDNSTLNSYWIFSSPSTCNLELHQWTEVGVSSGISGPNVGIIGYPNFLGYAQLKVEKIG